jgi:hypothetical protein
LDRRALEYGGLIVLAVLAVVALLVLERGETLKDDELGYAVRISPLGDGFFVPPMGKYLIPLPLLVYRGLFETLGLGSYLPYELAGIGLVVLCAVLFFLLAKRRIGPLALAPTAILLFFGAASEVTVTGTLRLPELISVGAGLGMMLALERRNLTGDFIGALLLAASLFSHPTGVAFAAAAGVIILLRPGSERWRSLWVLLAPACAWAVVWLSVRPPNSGHAPLHEVPGFVLQSLVAVSSAITGATWLVHSIPSRNPVGWALASVFVAGSGAVLWTRRRRRQPPPPTFWAALVALVVLWAVTALAPGGSRSAEASRYMYAGGVIMLLALVELADGLRLPSWAALAVTMAAAASLVLNVAQLRNDAATWRSWSDYIRAEETSLELAGRHGDLSLIPEDPSASPPIGDHRMILGALSYIVISSLWGSPAYTPGELRHRPPNVRWAADVVLARALGVQLRRAGASPRAASPPPSTRAVVHGRVTARGNCVRLRPVGARLTADLALPRTGLWISDTAPGNSLSLHRFAPFPGYPLSPIPKGHAALLRIPPDSASMPWRLAVSARRPMRICTAP